MRTFPLITLLGCTSSLSNDVFFEDARFVAGLPSDTTAAPPSAFDGLEGNAEVLPYVHTAVAQVDVTTAAARAAGESLRSAVVAERSDVHRRWDAVAVILEAPDGAMQAWARGEVLLIDENETEWTIEIATDAAGPWEVVGSGQHFAGEDGLDQGAWTWKTGVEAALTGDTRGGIYELSYHSNADSRDISIVVRPDLLSTPTAEFRLIHDAGIVFPAVFSLDGTSIPGAAVAVHSPEGGRLDGFLAPDSTGFSACWDGVGDAVYLGPDPTVPAYGDEENCVIDSLVGR